MSAALRGRLEAGEQLVGGIVRMPCEDLIDMIGVAGLDFVVIDCEHGPPDVVPLRQHIAFAEAHGVGVLVRTGEREDGLVLRALDQGAQGIVVPHVDDAEQARQVVASAHYPPRGRRGFATYPRAGGFGTADAEAHRSRMSAETLVIVMIESPIGVRNAEEILAVDGVDGYLVGVADLGASSGPGDPSVAESLAAVAAAAERQGKLRADIVGTPQAGVAAHGDGAHLVVHNIAAAVMSTLQGLRIS